MGQVLVLEIIFPCKEILKSNSLSKMWSTNDGDIKDLLIFNQLESGQIS